MQVQCAQIIHFLIIDDLAELLIYFELVELVNAFYTFFFFHSI